MLESSYARIFPRPYIRGLGNTDFDFNASQPVSFVYDEVVMENPVLKSFPLFDIDQVEALRGPQGTLFGRNTPAGVLKFDPPSRPRTSAATPRPPTPPSAPPTSRRGLRLDHRRRAGRTPVGIWMHRDDWIDNGFTGKDDVTGGYDQSALRGQLLYTPTEAFSALLNLHYTKLDGSPHLPRQRHPAGDQRLRPRLLHPRDDLSGRRAAHRPDHGKARAPTWKLTYDFGDEGPTPTSITAYEHVTAHSRGDVDGGFGAVFAPPSGPGLIPFTAESADGVPITPSGARKFAWPATMPG